MSRVARSAKWDYNYRSMHYVYILELQNGDYYTGYTQDLKKRLKKHSEGSTKTTKRIPPEELAFYAAFKTKTNAIVFEKYLKSSSGFAFRNKRLI